MQSIYRESLVLQLHATQWLFKLSSRYHTEHAANQRVNWAANNERRESASEHKRLSIPASKCEETSSRARGRANASDKVQRGARASLVTAMAWACMLHRDFEGRVRVGVPAIRARESHVLSAPRSGTHARAVRERWAATGRRCKATARAAKRHTARC